MDWGGTIKVAIGVKGSTKNVFFKNKKKSCTKHIIHPNKYVHLKETDIEKITLSCEESLVSEVLGLCTWEDG